MSRGMAARVRELSAGRVPFVHATVVRAQVPSSAKAGDDVRVLPDDSAPFPESPGAQVVVNTCLSGGALEIFLQPMLPAPLIEVVGNTPVADALVRIADVLEYATARSLPGAAPENASAVVVASHGRDEHEAIRLALAAGVPYIALVASRRRGAAVLDELELTPEQRARVSTPAGLDIGARTAGEVALSILAEVIETLRSADPAPGRTGDDRPAGPPPAALPQPLLEGEPGGGKTAAAKALAAALGTRLIRLQCYEGLTVGEALYEWNYQRQLLAIRLAESRHEALRDADLFTAEFLQERPILRAVRHRGPTPPVLLIDEIDRADDEFEALLFEFLGESAINIPEIGTFTAVRPPIVVLTSNRSRELHDALRRRCLYHWIDFPAPQRAAEILRRSVPAANAPLIASTTAFIGRVRELELDKPPGLAEAIDWLGALSVLGAGELVRTDVLRTLSTIAKTPDDRDTITAALDELGYAGSARP